VVGYFVKVEGESSRGRERARLWRQVPTHAEGGASVSRLPTIKILVEFDFAWHALFPIRSTVDE